MSKNSCRESQNSIQLSELQTQKPQVSHGYKHTINTLQCILRSLPWGRTEETSGKPETFRMWTYRRVLSVLRLNRVTDVNNLYRMKKKQELLNAVKARNVQYPGHILTNTNRYRILQNGLDLRRTHKENIMDKLQNVGFYDYHEVI